MIKLTQNKVAVRPAFDPDVSPGGIIIPDQAKSRADQGIVKHVGPEVKDIKIGDYVIFSGYTGTMVIIEGEGRFIIMPEEFIICKVDRKLDKLKVPGVYFKDVNDEYFVANYEQIIELCSQAVTEARLTLEVKEIKK